MAITVTGLPLNKELISTYNPNLVTFVSDSLLTPNIAGVLITVPHLSISKSFSVTPDNNNEFTFDFQDIMSDLTKEAKNYLEPEFLFPDIGVTLLNALFIDSNVCTDVQISFYIFDGSTLIDSTTDITYFYIKSSQQILNSNIMTEYSATVGIGGGFEYSLVPFVDGNQGFKVWQGFPIEFTFDALDSTLTVVQNANGTILGKPLTPDEENRFIRLVLIDYLGNELTDINDNLVNNLDINATGGSYAIDTTCFVEYMTVDCPDDSKYFRFLNSRGGFTYYLFEDVVTTERQRSNRNRVNRRQTSLENMSSRSVSLGNDTDVVLVVSKSNTDDIDNVLLNELISSPMIQLWEGGNKWRRLDMISNSGKLSTKQVSQNYTFSFDLGTLYNQSI